ncbi:hypothetical protein [Cyclobacterium qasimii]|nr:hypothetical protein [Cyclobacterium qasimii]EPR70929.1 hypothetical protein ADICYQ_0743 [Cyclobacterium qasimii M12-11B]
MQEKWVFKSENIKKAEDFESAFSSVLKENMNELEIFLSLYTKLDGALAENIHLLEPLKAPLQASGFISLGFNKSFYNACLNINEADLDKIKLAYNFNVDEGQLILTGPDIPEREPDDL